MLNNLWIGLLHCLYPYHFLMLCLGVFVGIWVAAIPGISGAIAIAILLPITFYMPAEVGFVLLVSIYCAGLFGGSLSAILFRVPGSSPAAATVFDGYELTRKGQAGKAIGTAILASAFGGIFSVILLITISPLLIDAVLAFGPAEYFSLVVFGLSVVGGLIAKSLLKGTIMVLIGLLLQTIGIDQTSGVNRFSFGTSTMMSGFDFIPVMMGIFAVGEVFHFAVNRMKEIEVAKGMRVKAEMLTWKEILALTPTFLRGSLIGSFIGALPGAGGTLAAFISYAVESRVSGHPEQFGTGILAGVAAPESSNNASSGGAMIPTFTLGIPGSEVTALLLAGLTIHGLQPGPLLFIQNAEFVYTVYVAMLLANIVMLFMAFPIARVFTKALLLPREILFGVILLISLVGAYAIRFNLFDIWTVFIFGIIGFFMRRYNWPQAPIILGMVLGPLMESNFRNALLSSQKDFTIFFTRPISAVFLLMALLSYLIPIITSNVKKRHKV